MEEKHISNILYLVSLFHQKRVYYRKKTCIENVGAHYQREVRVNLCSFLSMCKCVQFPFLYHNQA